MKATEATKAAHALLGDMATSPVIIDYIRRLEHLQRVSEEENWWNTDLGIAVEDAMGHLRLARERAERR